MTWLPLVGVGLAVELGAALLWSPRLQIHRVTVEGNRVARAEDMLDRINVPCGTPIVLLSVHSIEEKLQAEPSVARAEVETRWPDALAIRITERTASWNVQTDAGWSQADASGKVFKRVAAPSTSLPQLAFPGRSLEPGATLPAATLASARECLRWAQNQPTIPVTMVEIDPTGKFSLKSTDGPMIHLGSPVELERKLWTMTRLAKEIQELPSGKSIEYVNLYKWDAPAVRFRDLADLSG